MNLRKALLEENSKLQVNKLVDYIGANPKRFAELVRVYLEGPYRITQRASWALSYAIERNPKLIKPHFKKILDQLKFPGVHDAVKRNTIRLLQFADIPKKFEGHVIDLCFNFINNKKEPVAIKAFSITVLGRIVKDNPELLRELKLVLEDQMPYASPAFLVRARKIIQLR